MPEHYFPKEEDMNRKLILLLFISQQTLIFGHGGFPGAAGSVLSIQGTASNSEKVSIYTLRSNFNVFLLFLNFGLELQALGTYDKLNSEAYPLHATAGVGLLELLMIQYVTSGHLRTGLNIFPMKRPWSTKNAQLGGIRRLGLTLAYDKPVLNGENQRFLFGVSICFCDLQDY
jgi:hypothetical protein